MSRRLSDVDLIGLSIPAMYDSLYEGTDYGVQCMPWHGLVTSLAGRFQTVGIQTVLEVGFGRGQVLKAFASCGFNVTGSEVAWGPIREASSRGYGALPDADLQYLPNRSYDLVLSLNVVDHIRNGDSERMIADHWRLTNRCLGVLVNADPKFKMQEVPDDTWKATIKIICGVEVETLRRKNSGVLFLAWRKEDADYVPKNRQNS